MSSYFRGILLSVFLSFGGAVAQGVPSPLPDLQAQLSPATQQSLQREARLIVDLLQNYHFSGRPFRDVPNDEIVDRYLQSLDPQGDYILEPDRVALKRRFNRTLKSVYFFRGDLLPAFEIFNRFSARADARLQWVAARLERSFHASDEAAEFDPAPTSLPADAAAADRRWEQRLRDLVLREQLTGRTEAEARERIAARFAKHREALGGIDAITVRERFIDAALRCFDPHSGYFSDETTRHFAREMGEATAGIGVAFAIENNRCIVTAISPGNPADLQTDLRPGDELLSIMSEAGSWTSTGKLARAEISALLHGEAGGELNLRFRRPGETADREANVRRANLVQPEDRARGAVALVPAHEKNVARRIGWVSLPSFYGQPEGSGASVSRDTRELIEKMRPGALDGLVIDLRENPGGLLLEAVELASLFVIDATVMHASKVGSPPEPMRTSSIAPLFAGPLIILTSHRTASAGEAFAGAMQFHQRGIVVGDEFTFGKGTMQIYLDLAKPFAASPQDTARWGTARVTAERYYLPDGRSVQRDGIKADIVLPKTDTFPLRRESMLDHAVSSGSITPSTKPVRAVLTDSQLVTPALIETLNQQCATRASELVEWSLWRRAAELRESENTNTPRSLSLARRESEFREQHEKRATLRRAWREWSEREDWPYERVEITPVNAMLDAVAAAASMRSKEVTATEILQRRHAFVVGEANIAREIPLGQVRFGALAGEADLLAPAFAAGSGREISTATLRALLLQIDSEDRQSFDALLACLRRHLADEEHWTDTERLNGFAALLALVPTLNLETQAHPPLGDVPLREALRLAADWADRRPAPASSTPHSSSSP